MIFSRHYHRLLFMRKPAECNAVGRITSALCLVLCSAAYMKADEQIDFSRDVRPILSDRCYFCHGPDAERREADLRLDDQAAAHASVIVPGQPSESELVERILSSDPETMMPPPDSNLSLTDKEKSVLQKWVKQGAQYDEHWAFSSVAKPQVPSKSQAAGGAPIDQFVRQVFDSSGLASQGLTLSPVADKTTLIRRLSLDLTGIPPTVAEVDAFLADDAPSAYEKVVDRLLASERFGERMAVDWLDVARYADTYGYQNDRYRAMWPWRDWVVDAFNENLSFDNFITWQIAGDLLPNASREQILATAFNRNHRQTNEGGSVEEEFRAEYVADRVNTFGAAFLGLTLECCRCHDHKYDPISQREYYQLAAFFNNIDESGLYSHFTQATPTPTLVLSAEEQQQELDRIAEEIHAKERECDALQINESKYTAWRESLVDVRSPVGFAGTASQDGLKLADALHDALSKSLVGHFSFESIDSNSTENAANPAVAAKLSDTPELVGGVVGQGLLLSGENNVTTKVGGDFSRNQAFSYSLWMNPPVRFDRAVILHRSRAWTDSASRGYELLIEEGKLSAALIHFWPGNAIRVVAKEELPIGRWSQITVTYDGSSHASGLAIYRDGERMETEVVRDKLTKHIRGSDGFGGGDSLDLSVGQRFRDVGFKDGRVDELRVFEAELSPLEVHTLYLQDALPANVGEVLYNLPEHVLRDFYFRHSAPRQSIVNRLRELRDQRSQVGDPISEIMVMREEPKQRPTYILSRGAYDAPTEQVQRATLDKILPTHFEGVPSRKDLADWLVHPRHPLTSRVAVNRFWQMLFGQGLVSTAEDFGLQGSLPTHPELLDWLAAEFVDSGWNVKHLLKMIVMSDTYRRRSDLSATALELDPENALLARGPANRLPAEMIRDAALAASGLLVEKVGGPPTKPFQPEGLWKEKSGEVYKRDEGEGSHRRSLYTFWKRTSPPPAMMTLDASNREVCVVKRQVTMTPMQMLVLLNDPQYVEAARALAARSIAHSNSADKQIEFVFRSLVSRRPSAQELQVLSKVMEQQKFFYAENLPDAKALVSVGDQYEPPSDVDLTTLAALTIVAEGLMTYDETVMKR